MNPIYFTTPDKPYAFLSNFYIIPEGINIFVPNYLAKGDVVNVTGNTVEALFQAHKATNQEDFLRVAAIEDPLLALKAGRKLHIRDDWFDIKFDVMRKIISLKFPAHKVIKVGSLSYKLAATGTAELREGSKGNNEWGWSDGNGNNALGHILMDHRAMCVEARISIEGPHE